MSRRRRGGRSARTSTIVDPMIGKAIDLSIDEIGSSGDGVGRVNGRPVYVPLALPGDALTVRISARRGAGYAADPVETRTLTPRKAHFCAHFGICGGCRLQHLQHDDYRTWKHRQVASALASRGLSATRIEPMIDGTAAARRRVRLAFQSINQKLSLGFRRRSKKDVVDVDQCPITLPAIVALLNPLRTCLRSCRFAANGGEILITAADNGLDLLLEAPIEPGLNDREALAAFAENRDLARVSWRSGPHDMPEPIAARRQPMIDVGGIPVALPIGAFLQATVEAERAIRETVAKVISGSTMIVDLFAGCGALSLPFAKEKRRVLAIERDPSMTRSLAAAAAGANLPGHVDAKARDLDREPLSGKEIEQADVLILDPPRPGAKAQVEAIAAADGQAKIAMVSCNPATFARDSRILIDAGYQLNWVQPIDAFLYAAEIELVGAFERVKGS